MLLYLNCIQILMTTFVYLLPFTQTMTVLASAVASALFMLSGYTLHVKDLPEYLLWVQYVDPAAWLLPFLLSRELSPEAIQSSSGKILCQVKHQDIIVQLPCSSRNGTTILKQYGFHKSEKLFFDYDNPPVAMICFYVVLSVIACVVFTMNCCGRNKTANRRGHNYTNTP
nr:unnamed protein product [Callosobruchus analis]